MGARPTTPGNISPAAGQGACSTRATMKLPHAFEARAFGIVEALRRGESAPDGSTTLFPAWPAPRRGLARQLAACANAARGRDLLWLVGIDPGRAGSKALRGALVAQAEAWVAHVSAHFDGIAPRMLALEIPYAQSPRRRSVVALHIETGRAPFVVCGPRGQRETPWLDGDGAGVRPARRLELVTLLSPLQDLPGLEILEADLSVYKNPHVSAAARATFRWTLDAAVYVMPGAEARVVIPLHRCRGTISIAGSSFRNEATDVSLTADKNSPAIRITESAALIEGLGRFFIYCCGSTREPDLSWQNPAELLFDCTPAGSARAAVGTATLRCEAPSEANQAGRWRL